MLKYKDDAVPIAGFLILEAIVRLGEHVQTRREQNDVLGKDGQFTLVGLARATDNTDNVATTQVFVHLGKIALRIATKSKSLSQSITIVRGVGVNLDLGAIGVQIVKL